MKNNITYNGLTFMSEHDESYFHKRRSRRLQKKLSVGEFFSVIVHIHVDHHVESDDDIDFLIDRMLSGSSERLYAVSLWQAKTADIYVVDDGNNNVDKMNEYQTYLREEMEWVFNPLDDDITITFDIFHDE